MRIFSGGIATETNTFSPIPTGLADFPVARTLDELDGILGGDAIRAWQRMAADRSWDFTFGLYSFAQPAGATTRATYETLRDELLGRLGAAGPVDVVLLLLHGAMVADGYDDCETDLTQRVREIVGPKVKIGVELDLHCDIAQATVDVTDVIVLYKESPHTDIVARAEEVFTLTTDAALGRIDPKMAVIDSKMLGFFRTPVEPMRSFVDHMSEREGVNGVLSVSLAHGFPWADVPSSGGYVLVIANGDAAKARSVAGEVADELYALRREVATPMPPIAQALDQALAVRDPRPVVIADVADNAGGGAPSDSTFVLREMLNRGITNAALALMWDPIVVQLAQAAGVGGTLRARLGGKMGPASGDPLDVVATVRGLRSNLFQRWPQLQGALNMPCGDAAWLEIAGIDVIVNSLRTQVFSPDVFSAFGIPYRQRGLLVVKSSQHFYAGFEPIAARILYASTPGTLNYDFSQVPYQRLDRARFPTID